MSVFQLIKLALSLVPEIVNIILMLEKVLPQANIGTEKMTALRKILLAAYEGLGSIMPSIEIFVNIFVELFNKFGWPDKKEEVPVVPVVPVE